MMSGVQENQPLSWLPDNDSHNMLVPNEPNFLSQSQRSVHYLDVFSLKLISLPTFYNTWLDIIFMKLQWIGWQYEFLYFYVWLMLAAIWDFFY